MFGEHLRYDVSGVQFASRYRDELSIYLDGRWASVRLLRVRSRGGSFVFTLPVVGHLLALVRPERTSAVLPIL